MAYPAVCPRLNRPDGLTPWPGQFERYLAPLTPILALQSPPESADPPDTALYDQVALGGSAGETVMLVAVLVGVLGQETFVIHKVYTKQHREVDYQDRQGRRHEQRYFFYTQAWRTHDAALDWLRRIARPEDVIATSTPHWAYLKTGSRAILPPFEADVRAARDSSTRCRSDIWWWTVWSS